MQRSLDTLTHDLLRAAKAAGAEQCDAMALAGTSVSVDVREGALEKAARSEGVDIGLRVFVGARSASVSASDLSDHTIATMAERAVAMAKSAPEDPNAMIAEPDQIATDWDADALDLYDPTPEPAPDALQEDARRCEAAAMDTPGITQVQSANATYSERRIHIATSNGFSGGYRRSGRAISCVAITGTGSDMERDYDGDSRVFQSDLRDAADIGALAARRTLERIGGRKPPTGAYPVILDERVSSTLLGHILGAVNGASIAKGTSWLRDDLGKVILPTSLSIYEDPHRPRATASRPFDAEGIKTHPRHIVENGVLAGWTLDLATARKLGMSTTGNATRGTSSAPSPSSWNIKMTQGHQSRADLLRDMGTGLLVTSFIGSTINPNTGDYSRGVSGFWVENGEIAYPVNEGTIAGNLRDMIRAMIPANDARTYLSRVMPSVLIEGMTLAGA